NDAKNLSPFWGQRVLVSLDVSPLLQAETKMSVAIDLRLGILRCKKVEPDRGGHDISWVAVLDPLDKLGPEQRSDDAGFVVGRLVKDPPEVLKALLANAEKAWHTQ